LADLLEWLTEQRLPDLKANGMTDADLFTLRRIANAYRNNNLTPETYSELCRLVEIIESTELYL